MNKYIYGMHDEPPAEGVFGPNRGWLCLTRAIGCDPDNHDGEDFQRWTDDGYTVITRLNHGYAPDGTIPAPERYGDFARRCANFVANSQGCNLWIIGNEPNHSQERPQGQEISAWNYVKCFDACWTAIKAVSESHQIIITAIAPWNIETGDWLDYFESVLNYTSPSCRFDGIALHAYTHGTDPDLVFSDAKMASHPDRYYHFRAYKDFMARIPAHLRHLPVYITETNQDMPWADVNSGWVQNAYAEINAWNSENEPTIRCLCLYRWPRYDKWYIAGKQGVIDDFLEAQLYGFTWTQPDEEDGMVEVDLPLINPGFEEGFREVGAPEVKVANGWWPWWHETDARPEYKPAEYDVDPVRIHSGQFAQQWFVRWRTYTAGIYQQVENVPVGKMLVFEAHCQAWSTGTENPRISDGRLSMRIGIDPYGGTDPEGADVVWSEAVPLAPMHPDEYVAFRVEALARSDRCTVFGWSQCQWDLSHHDAYMDACRLFYLDVEESEPDPDPEPGPDLDALRAWIVETSAEAHLAAAAVWQEAAPAKKGLLARIGNALGIRRDV